MENEFRKIVVVMPAFNEAQRIGSVIMKVQRVLPEAQLVVIDDGSTDGTADAARRHSATVLRLPTNQGYGVALQAGYTYAREMAADIVVQLDSDGQHDPESIPVLLEAMQDPAVDVVIGSRFLDGKEYRMPLLRSWGRYFFRFVLRFLTRQKWTDPTSGFQAIRGTCLPFFTSEAFPVDYPDADVIFMLWLRGFCVKEVRARFYPSPPGKVTLHSGLRPFYYVAKMLFSLFLTLIRPHPRRKPVGSVRAGVENPENAS